MFSRQLISPSRQAQGILHEIFLTGSMTTLDSLVAVRRYQVSFRMARSLGVTSPEAGDCTGALPHEAG